MPGKKSQPNWGLRAILRSTPRKITVTPSDSRGEESCQSGVTTGDAGFRWTSNNLLLAGVLVQGLQLVLRATLHKVQDAIDKRRPQATGMSER